MSSIYAQFGNGPFKLKWHESLGATPFTATSKLLGIVSLPEEKRHLQKFEDLVQAWREFRILRNDIRRLIEEMQWKSAQYDRRARIFLNLRCERCTLKEAQLNYLEYLPAAIVPPNVVFEYDANARCEAAFNELQTQLCSFSKKIGEKLPWCHCDACEAAV